MKPETFPNKIEMPQYQAASVSRSDHPSEVLSEQLKENETTFKNKQLDE